MWSFLCNLIDTLFAEQVYTLLGYCQQSWSLQNYCWYWRQGECIRSMYLGLVGFKVCDFFSPEFHEGLTNVFAENYSINTKFPTWNCWIYLCEFWWSHIQQSTLRIVAFTMCLGGGFGIRIAYAPLLCPRLFCGLNILQSCSHKWWNLHWSVVI